MSGSEGGIPGIPGEISEANPAAVRGPNGIWNEVSLPMLDWEEAEYRIVLPIALQQALGIDVPVLRVSGTKLEAMLLTHPRDRGVVQYLSRYVVRWQYAGTEVNSPDNRKRILFPDDHARWYAMTVGQDINGSWNVITIFGGSKPGFLENRLRGLADVVEREK